MGQHGGLVTHFVRTPQDTEIARVVAQSLKQEGDGNWDKILSYK